jgi:alanine racemase
MQSGSQKFSTWLEIDLSAIENNVGWLIQNAGAAVMAVVKANGYGHGAVPVAKAAIRAGASFRNTLPQPVHLGVARLEEALELRQGGVSEPILILGYTPPDRFDETISNQISLTAWEPDQIQAIKAATERTGKSAIVHLKVDSGMSRLGAAVEDAVDLGVRLAQTTGIVFEGIFTHFARSDEADTIATDLQLRSFEQVLTGLRAKACLPPIIHAANSAACLSRLDATFNMVRPGIAIYGLHPSPVRCLPEAFRPALSWKAVISQVKVLPAGRGISYGHEYITSRSERIGTVPVGYADGFRRTRGNRIILRGSLVPVIGRICMDQLMVQLDAVPQAQKGDEVVLIGRQGEAALCVEDVAAAWGTISYEVVCAIGPRVPRLYV